MSDAVAAPPEAPLLLIDGNSLAYRAFHALPDTIATADGFPTNALYGLAAMMMKMLVEERPGRVVVAWDAKGKTFRHEAEPTYKANRKETPDLLREQSVHFRPLMEAFGFVNTELPGYEADDILGTLARRAEAAGRSVVILTGDRDAFQLVSDRVSVMATGRGVTDTTLYTPEAVVERYGIGPDLMPDFRGMVGDPSDNLLGVPGIGEKGASQLLQKYGSLDAILEHAGDQTPKRREALTEHADQARRTRGLAVIDTDAPVDLDLDDVPALEFDEARMAALREVFDRFEFGSLLRRLDELADGGAAAAPPPAATVVRAQAVDAAPEDLGMRFAGAEGLALALGEDGWAVAGPGDEVPTGPPGEGTGAALAAALAGAPVACHDAKAVVRDTGEALRPVHDTMIAAYLLEPRRRSYALEELAESAGLGVEGDPPPRVRDAVLVRELAARQRVALAREGLETLYREIELPVTRVLAAMERVGVRLDVHRLGEIAGRVRDRADELRDRIWEEAGGEFVIDSPKQLGQVLFERLGLPTFRKGKTGWSTDRKVLKLLEDKHPIVRLIGQYRELTKLDNTYLSALPELVDEHDRLHTTFNQTVAETGRLSSTNPNLQNIPIRTPLGREIRGAFTTDPGWVLISCDYSQVELRILAHTSGEPALADAFRRGEDVHRATAAEVFGMAPADVDRTTRDRAKAVNFGIVYGISDFGLSEQLGIPRADAKLYIDAYLARYPRVRSFIDTTIAAAAQDGYVTTLLGRRRPIPELGGRTVAQRNLGERLAVNTVIQGTAADIIKAAMVGAHRALAEEGLRARLLLQIHDELVLEAPQEEAAAAAAVVRSAMVGAYPLDPPLAVDVGMGETWLEAKS
ncbi:DNA polymerase I [Miltoncostaea marina]|uniref:DNA polymerase I n=1 Tax=Miltoncostaea marina TaxID=2843215 RepID=UPI001C3E4DCB|nr:DNA polymerase I [Miltoncostaea marina]